MCETLPGMVACSVAMNAGAALSAGGGGSVGPLGGAGAAFGAAAPAAAAAGFAAAGAAGFAAAGAAGFAGGVGLPVAELVSLVVAVVAAAGFSGFGAGGSVRAEAGAVAETPAPGASVRDTSPFSGSPGTSLAGLSAAASGGVFGSSAFKPIRARLFATRSSSRRPG